jgi:hypothetical protein
VPRALNRAPEPGTFRFVLRRCHRNSALNPEIENLVPGYDESTKTRDITHPDGIRAQTVFILSPHFAQRLRCLGWVDVTDAWSEAGWMEAPPGHRLKTEKADKPSTSLAKKAARVAAAAGGVQAVKG